MTKANKTEIVIKLNIINKDSVSGPDIDTNIEKNILFYKNPDNCLVIYNKRCYLSCPEGTY